MSVLRLANINVRCFVMVVQEYPHMTHSIQAHLRSVGIEAEEFPCVCAFDPDTKKPVCGLTTVHTYDVDNPGQGYTIGPKGVSLSVSFLMFWTMAMFLPDDYFFFIEWDALFAPDWKKRTEQALRDVPPDFDFLFVGSCCCNEKPKKHIKGEVWSVEYPMCNHAQIIAKKAMPTLVRTQRKIYAPVDISLAFHAFPHLKVYTMLPRAAAQRNTIIPP